MVRVGVVGCGYWGPNLVRNFYQELGRDLRVCCDQSEIFLCEGGQGGR